MTRASSLNPQLRLWLMAFGLLCLSGCTVGPKYQRPSAPVPPAYKENAGWQPAAPADDQLRGNWWEIFGDPQLNDLESKVTVSNQQLKVALAQYEQAHEAVAIARSNLYPTLQAGPSYSRNAQSFNSPLHIKTAPNYYSEYAIQGSANYEPDLWGSIRRNVEENRELAQASAGDLAAASLSLHGELAQDYFLLRGLDTQTKLVNDTIAAYEQALQLTENRYHGGIASEQDVALARTQLETTRAQGIDIAVGRAQYEHAIAVLIGMPASDFTLPPLLLTQPPPPVPAGIPSQVLERRPDISAAERRAAAANAQIGVTVAAYYPIVSLSGSGGLLSGVISTLVQGPSSLWSVGGNATETLFDAGRRHAAKLQAVAAYDQQVANYRQVTLGAFQEVEDNLSGIRILQEEQVTEHAAVQSAQRSVDLSLTRYKGGITAYLEVITAQATALADERADADILTRRYVDDVQLIRAIGGGWDTSQLPRD